MRNILSFLLLMSSLTIFAQTNSNQQNRTDSVYLVCDRNPEFQDSLKGLKKFIANNLIYPENLLLKGIQGKVIVSLTIEKDGTIEEMDLLDKPNYYFAQEAVRILSLTSGKWKPGEINGKKVRAYYTVPVNFKIVEDSVYSELKSDNSVVCPEKTPEFIGGTQKMSNFFNDNVCFSNKDKKGQLTARVVLKKSKQTLEIETRYNDYVSASKINSINKENNNGRYPAIIVADEQVDGETFVQFVIEKDGMVSRVKIIETNYDRLNHPNLQNQIKILEDEIIRLIFLSAGKWTSAEINCKKVRIYYTLPVIWKYIFKNSVL